MPLDKQTIRETLLTTQSEKLQILGAEASSRPSGIPSEEFERELISRHDAGNTLPLALHRYLKLDTWKSEQALPLLLGIDPDHLSLARFVEDHPDGAVRTAALMSARYLDHSLVCLSGYSNHRIYLQATDADREVIHKEGVPITSFVLMDLGIRLQGLEELWDSGQHAERNSPAHFIAWAESKGIEIPWLDWARKEELLSQPAPTHAGKAPGRQVAPFAEVASEQRQQGEEWKDLARKRAHEIIAIRRASDLFPSQTAIADEIAREFREAEKFGVDGKPLTGAYIKRHALKGISSAEVKQLSTSTSRGN
jgi:hypothetical protein